MDSPECVLVWDMRTAAAAAPASAIKTQCDFQCDGDDCARLLCEKIAASLCEDQLRELFGIENFEVKYERYKASIAGSLCGAK